MNENTRNRKYNGTRLLQAFVFTRLYKTYYYSLLAIAVLKWMNWNILRSYYFFLSSYK